MCPWRSTSQTLTVASANLLLDKFELQQPLLQRVDELQLGTSAHGTAFVVQQLTRMPASRRSDGKGWELRDAGNVELWACWASRVPDGHFSSLSRPSVCWGLDRCQWFWVQFFLYLRQEDWDRGTLLQLLLVTGVRRRRRGWSVERLSGAVIPGWTRPLVRWVWVQVVFLLRVGIQQCDT